MVPISVLSMAKRLVTKQVVCMVSGMCNLVRRRQRKVLKKCYIPNIGGKVGLHWSHNTVCQSVANLRIIPFPLSF